jgi:hypothetical protein
LRSARGLAERRHPILVSLRRFAAPQPEETAEAPEAREADSHADLGDRELAHREQPPRAFEARFYARLMRRIAERGAVTRDEPLAGASSQRLRKLKRIAGAPLRRFAVVSVIVRGFLSGRSEIECDSASMDWARSGGRAW